MAGPLGGLVRLRTATGGTSVQALAPAPAGGSPPAAGTAVQQLVQNDTDVGQRWHIEPNGRCAAWGGGGEHWQVTLRLYARSGFGACSLSRQPRCILPKGIVRSASKPCTM